MTTTSKRIQDARLWSTRDLALVVIGLGLALRAPTTLRGYFHLDDFALIARAYELSFVDPTYLGGPVPTGSMPPGARLVAWFVAHLFPLSFTPVAALMLVGQGLVWFLLWRLLKECAGDRPLTLVPLGVAVFSPLTLPTSTYWSYAIVSLPTQLALVVALYGLIRHLRSGSMRMALLGPVAVAAGLLFSDRSLLAVVPVLSVLGLWFGGTLALRHGDKAKRLGLLLAGYALVVLTFLSLTLPQWRSAVRQHLIPARELIELAWTSWFTVGATGLVGGPFQWSPVGYAGAVANPAPILTLASAAIVVAVIVGTCALHRGAVRAWAVLGTYLIANLVLLALRPPTSLGPRVALAPRQSAELPLVAALALALATMPLSGSWSVAPTRISPTEDVRDRWRSALDALRAGGALPNGGTQKVFIACCVALLGLSAAWSTVAYDPWWTHTRAREWVTTSQTAVRDLPDGIVIGDAPAPEWLASGLLSPYNGADAILRPALRPTQQLRPWTPVPVVAAPDDDGVLRQSVPAGALAARGPVADCGWQVGLGTVRIPLKPPSSLTPSLRISYEGSASTTLPVTVAGRRLALPVDPGKHSLIVQVTGAIDGVTFHPTLDGSQVCVDDLTAGPLQILPGTTP